MRRPQPQVEEDSRVAMPQAALPESRQLVGKLDDEDTVSLDAPAVERKNRGHVVPAAAVGLRAATPKPAASSNVVTKHKSQVKQQVQVSKDDRKQKVWNKLDNAKRQATQKLERIKTGFDPKSGS